MQQRTQMPHQHTGYNLNEDSISNYKKNSLSNYGNIPIDDEYELFGKEIEHQQPRPLVMKNESIASKLGLLPAVIEEVNSSPNTHNNTHTTFRSPRSPTKMEVNTQKHKQRQTFESEMNKVTKPQSHHPARIAIRVP